MRVGGLGASSDVAGILLGNKQEQIGVVYLLF